MKCFTTFLSAFLVLCMVSLASSVQAQAAPKTGQAQTQSSEAAKLAKQHPYADVSYIQRTDLTKEQKIAIFQGHFQTYNNLPNDQKKAWLNKNPQVNAQMEKESVLLRHQYGYKVPADLLVKYNLQNAKN
ncbi:MAG: hypothetical protein R2830_11660 [Saprospiraceae bacterium]